MNRLRNLIAIAAFSFVVMGLPAIASAQYNGRYDPNRQNGGSYGNGQYRNSGYGDTRSAIRSLKSKARDFQRQIDRDLDRSRYNGSNREDQINDVAKRFRDAVNRLNENDFSNNTGRYGNGGYTRGDTDIRRVMDMASQIDRTVGRSNVSYASREIWSSIRGDLNYLGRGYNTGNGRGTTSGGWNTGRNGMPSWWPF